MFFEPPAIQHSAVDPRPIEDAARCYQDKNSLSKMNLDRPRAGAPARDSTASSDSDSTWGYVSPYVPTFTPDGRPTRLIGIQPKADGVGPQRLEILDRGCSPSNGANSETKR